MSEIEILHPDQVWDITRTCFFIRLRSATKGKRFYFGHPVYEDATGRRLIIVPRGVEVTQEWDWGVAA